MRFSCLRNIINKKWISCYSYKFFQVEPSSEAAGSGAADDAAPNLVIWGTDVVVSRCKQKFKAFINNFIEPNAEEDERLENMDLNEPLYLQKLEEVNYVLSQFIFNNWLDISYQFY